MKFKILIILSVFIFSQSLAQINGAKSLVNLIPAPLGSLVPDVVKDSNGVVHVVYAKNQNAYYIRSTDNGATFSAPVQVNSSGTVEFNMGERGPKLSVGIDGVIHVVWMDHWSSGVNVYARYSRSTNGGATFENLKSVSATSGVDGVTVAADGNNHVCVFWHTMVPVQTQVPEATWLHKSMSTDNGVTFSTDTNVVITNHNGLACSMCMTRARFGKDGNVYLAFRSAQDSIRDFFVLKGSPVANNFTAIRVNNDNWKINYCPMVGPSLEVGNAGRQFCAFMSNSHVYWAVSDTGATAFMQHVATPLNEANEIFPSALENHAGQVLFLWQVGPMSVYDSATVKWAVYNANGTFTGLQGTAGRTFSGTKATAFVGTDDNFYIIVNADILLSLPTYESNSNISVFPNPANNQISITGIAGFSKIKLLNASGEIVLEKETSSNTSIDVSRFAQGEYTIVIENNKGMMFKKVIVVK